MEADRQRSLDVLLVALAGRLAFWAAFALIAVDAVVDLWRDGSQALAVLAGLFAPVTFVVWPWQHEAFGAPLWIVFLVAVAARALAVAAVRGLFSPGAARGRA